MLKSIKIYIYLLLLPLFFSCVSSKEITYFQNDEIDQLKVSNDYTTVFKPDDLLQIVISSDDLASVKPFNLPSVVFSASTNTINAVPQQLPYLIDSKGEIDFPVLRKIKLGGLTREQGIELIKKKLDPDYIKNPTVNIRVALITALILVFAGAFAGFLPASRAARIRPIEALREQ